MKRSFFIIIEIIVVVVFFFIYLYPQLNQPSESPIEFKNLKVTLERTACYGACPDYTLTIYEDGIVIYDGRDFVKIRGLQSSRISQNKVKELVDEFYKINYFSLKDRYDAPITDLPTITTSIMIDGQIKKVVDYHGAPKELSELENKIDDITDSKKWIGICTRSGVCE